MPSSEVLGQRLSLLDSPQGERHRLSVHHDEDSIQQLAGAGVWGLTSQTSVKRWREHSGNCTRF